MTKKLVAVSRLDYGRDRIMAGEEFTASDSDAQVLIAIGLAKVKPAAPRSKEPDPFDEGEKTTRKKYKRRDMTAESTAAEEGEG